MARSASLAALFLIIFLGPSGCIVVNAITSDVAAFEINENATTTTTVAIAGPTATITNKSNLFIPESDNKSIAVVVKPCYNLLPNFTTILEPFINIYHNLWYHGQDDDSISRFVIAINHIEQALLMCRQLLNCSNSSRAYEHPVLGICDIHEVALKQLSNQSDGSLLCILSYPSLANYLGELAMLANPWPCKVLRCDASRLIFHGAVKAALACAQTEAVAKLVFQLGRLALGRDAELSHQKYIGQCQVRQNDFGYMKLFDAPTFRQTGQLPGFGMQQQQQQQQDQLSGVNEPEICTDQWLKKRRFAMNSINQFGNNHINSAASISTKNSSYMNSRYFAKNTNSSYYTEGAGDVTSMATICLASRISIAFITACLVIFQLFYHHI